MKRASALYWLCVAVTCAAATWCTAYVLPGVAAITAVICVIAMFRTADAWRATANLPAQSERDIN